MQSGFLRLEQGIVQGYEESYRVFAAVFLYSFLLASLFHGLLFASLLLAGFLYGLFLVLGFLSFSSRCHWQKVVQ